MQKNIYFVWIVFKSLIISLIDAVLFWFSISLSYFDINFFIVLIFRIFWCIMVLIKAYKVRNQKKEDKVKKFHFFKYSLHLITVNSLKAIKILITPYTKFYFLPALIIGILVILNINKYFLGEYIFVVLAIFINLYISKTIFKCDTCKLRAGLRDKDYEKIDEEFLSSSDRTVTEYVEIDFTKYKAGSYDISGNNVMITWKISGRCKCCNQGYYFVQKVLENRERVNGFKTWYGK